MNVSDIPLDLRELFFPHLKRAFEAGRAAGAREAHAAKCMAEEYQESMGAFDPTDAKDFRRYYAASPCGTYPAELHLHFGCTVKEFAAATGLRFTLFGGSECRWVPSGGRS